jgi:hypothetical protein
MKNITIFYIHVGYVSGTFTSMVDLYSFLKQKGNTIYFVIHSPNFHLTYKTIKKNFPFVKMDKISNHVKSDIIITSTDTLTKCRDYDIKLECDRIIFLDALGLVIAKYNNKEEEYFSSISKKYESILLGNKSNKWASKYFDSFVEYYHKFSPARLRHINSKMNHIYKILPIDSAFNFKTSNAFPHSCKELHYERWFEIKRTIYR